MESLAATSSSHGHGHGHGHGQSEHSEHSESSELETVVLWMLVVTAWAVVVGLLVSAANSSRFAV